MRYEILMALLQNQFPAVDSLAIEDAAGHALEASVRHGQSSDRFLLTVARNYILNRLRDDSKFVSLMDMMETWQEPACVISDAAIDFCLILERNFSDADALALFHRILGEYTLRDLADEHPQRSRMGWKRWLHDVAMPTLREKMGAYYR